MFKALKRLPSICGTPKYSFLQRAVGRKSFTLLDVGAGNHSPSKTTRLFPGCTYHGLDLNKDYSYDEQDEAVLSGFYEMDLTKLETDVIPDDFFDFIMMSHIIEHLYNGDEVLLKLKDKLKKGGHMYIEYPGQKSTKLPSMYGTLNFYDDPTHVRIYSVKELTDLFEKNGFRVVSSGMRKNWLGIVGTPLRVLGYWLRGKKLMGALFWDLMGFAEYVYVQKS